MKKKLKLIALMAINGILIGTVLQTFFLSLVMATNIEAQNIQSVREVTLIGEFENVSIEQCFKVIESKTNYVFNYNENDLNNTILINYKSKNNSVSDFLLELSKEGKLKFRQVNNTINVRQFIGDHSQVPEVEVIIQGITLTGKVTSDIDPSGLPGVNVIVKGTSTGTVTDVEGNYSLEVPDENSILVFSSVGFVQEEVSVGNKTVIDILLATDVTALEEIVVVGYGTMRKSDLTGAVGQISGDELLRIPSVSVAQSLQGRIPGVRVINSQEPGGGAEIRVRGISTINNSKPLYVIDGFLTDGMDHLHPTDIKSIEVLKDASSTSIYGSRGANGVILITTNSGSFDKKATVSVNSYVGSSQAVEFYDMANATQFSTLYLEAMDNAGANIGTQEKAMMDYIIANNLNGTDWQAEFYQPGFSQNHSINLNGGSKKMAYDISASYARESGIARDGFAQKLFLHANNDYKISDRITVGTKLNFFTSEGTHVSPTNGVSREPIIPAWDSYTNYYPAPIIQDVSNPAYHSDERIDYYISTPFKSFRAKAYINIDDLVLKGLSFRSNFGITNNFDPNKEYRPIYIIGNDTRFTTELEEERNESTDWVWSNYFTYNRRFNDHQINLTAGMESSLWQENTIGIKVFDVADNRNMWYVDQAQDLINRDVWGSAGHRAILSYYGRLNYALKDRYMVMLSMRRDGSSKFIGDYTWGNFPAVSFGWNIAEESFITGTSWIDFLKIRGGWGQVGNQGSAGLNDYAGLVSRGYQTTMGVNQNRYDGAVQLNSANQSIHWEVAEQSNIGIDYEFLGSRLTGSFDYFIRDTKDMIISTPIPYYAAKERPKYNSATMRSEGYEFDISYQGEVNSDFSYSISLNASTAKNEIRDLNEPIYGNGNELNTITQEGLPAGSFYGYQTDGIIKTQAELDEYLLNVSYGNPGIGDVRFVDQMTDIDGDDVFEQDGVITGDDRIVLGNPWPNFIAGADIYLKYKGFDLGLIFYGESGKDIWNRMAQIYGKTDMNGSNVFASRMDRWTPGNPDSDQPRMFFGDPGKNGNADDRYIVDGSYFRLRNLNIGYNLPQTVLDKIGVTNLRIYGSVDNVLTLSGYNGLNPEIGRRELNGKKLNAATSSGFDFNMYPVVRSFILGVNIGI